MVRVVLLIRAVKLKGGVVVAEARVLYACNLLEEAAVARNVFLVPQDHLAQHKRVEYVKRVHGVQAAAPIAYGLERDTKVIIDVVGACLVCLVVKGFQFAQMVNSADNAARLVRDERHDGFALPPPTQCNLNYIASAVALPYK